MDKSTLSNYGWIIIVTLILAVMLALATPFGTYVGDGVVAVANSFVQSADSAMDEDNIDTMKSQWEGKLDYSAFVDTGDTLNHKGIIPEGGIYVTGLIRDSAENDYDCCSICGHWCMCNTTIYRAGDNFPSTVKKYDLYIYGNYAYMYQAMNAFYFGLGCPYEITIDGIGIIIGFHDYDGSDASNAKWQVGLNTSNNEINALTSYGEILNSINNQPITHIDYLFCNTNDVPNVLMTTAPKIPQSVTSAVDAFWNLPSLGGTIQVPCHLNTTSWNTTDTTIEIYHYDGCGH